MLKYNSQLAKSKSIVNTVKMCHVTQQNRTIKKCNNTCTEYIWVLYTVFSTQSLVPILLQKWEHIFNWWESNGTWTWFLGIGNKVNCGSWSLVKVIIYLTVVKWHIWCSSSCYSRAIKFGYLRLIVWVWGWRQNVRNGCLSLVRSYILRPSIERWPVPAAYNYYD